MRRQRGERIAVCRDCHAGRGVQLCAPFYDPSSGDNCAVNVKTGSLYGTPTLTKVKLSVCANSAPATYCSGWNLPSQEDPTDDNTLYSYYAGPVKVPGAGHCIAVYAETDRTASDYGTYWSGAFHCG
jgi:hypothetical protein